MVDAKRVFDAVVSGAALVVLSPVLVVCAVAVVVDDPGPALFRQTRVGLGGHDFEILKFRSMRRGGGLQMHLAPAKPSADSVLPRTMFLGS